MHQPELPTARSPWSEVAAFAHAQDFSDDETTQLELLCSTVADVLSVPGVCVTSAEGACLAATTAQPPAVVEIDTLQYALGSGPGPTAVSDGAVVRVDDTRADDRWPAFLEAATAGGFRAILAVPLVRHHGTDAALSVYSTPVRTWSDDDRSAAVVLCAIATAWVSGSHVLREQAQVVGQLQHALDSRVLIEQAKGVLAVLERVTPTQAFELMRAHARRRGISVREVAQAVVHLGFRPPQAPSTTSVAEGERTSRGR